MMQQPILSPTLANKVYSLRSMRIGVLIGGPLVAGYLLAANYKNLGEEDKVSKTWLYAILYFIVLLIVALFTPDSVPNIVFAVVNYFVASFFIQKYQAAQLETHIAAGGRTYKTYRAVIAAVISMLLIFAIVLICFFIADAMGIAV